MNFFKKFIFMLLVFSALFSVSAFADIFTEPGFLRGTQAGTSFANLTDGNLSSSMTLDHLVISFDRKLITAVFLDSSVTYARITLYDDGVSVFSNVSEYVDDSPYWYYLPTPVYATSVDFYGAKRTVKEVDLLEATNYPKLTSLAPSDGSLSVSVYDGAVAVFDKPVKSLKATLTDGNGNTVSAKVTGLNTTNIIVTPSALLNYETTYTLTLSNVTASTGDVNPNTYTTTFTTQKDTTPVKLVNVIPKDGSTDVDVGLSKCVLEFNKTNIDTSTITSDNIYVSDSDGNVIDTTLDYSVIGGVFTVTASIPKLEYETDYYINVKDIKDTNANPLETVYNIRFKTSNDPNAFKILSYRPVNNSVVSLNRKVEIEFSKPISIDGLSYKFTDRDGNVISSVPQIVGTALYVTATLDYGKSYTFQLESVQSTDGQVLTNPITINFRTMNNTNNNFLNSLLGDMMDLFETVKYYGLKIVIGAIAIGVIFIVSLWLWKKLKKWLHRS